MTYLRFFYIIFSFSIFAQEPIETNFVSELKIETETLVGISNYDYLFYINNNVLYQKKNLTTINYSNLQLGDIYTANVFNPLKINLFYKDFNTAIILDNRLAEIYKIDFNSLQTYKNVEKITTGPDNTIWIFNQDLRQLELYDYKANTIRSKTLPVKSSVLDLKSNYNYCFLLTLNHLYVYNYFGSLITKHKNNGYTTLKEYKGNIILKKENRLYYLNIKTGEITPISTPNILINQFFVTNETLYIYNNKTLQQFHLKIK